jgi:hypothetical protein
MVAEWLNDAVDAIRLLQDDACHRVIQVLTLAGADPGSPVLTPEGWVQFGKEVSAAILNDPELADRSLLALMGRRVADQAWTPLMDDVLPPLSDEARLASWTELTGMSPVQLAAEHGEQAAKEIITAQIASAAIAAQPPTDLLADPRPVLDAVTRILEGAIDRQIEIWWSRSIGLGRPPTYRELGERYVISGTRVQQLELSAEHSARRLVNRVRLGPVGVAAQQVATALGPFFPTSQLRWPAIGLDRDLLRACGDLQDGLDRTQVGMLLLWLAGPYRESGQWLWRAGSDSLVDLRARILGAAQAGYPTLTEAEQVLEAHGVAPEARRLLLKEIDGLKIVDDIVCPWPLDSAGRAEAVLRVQGKPMTRGAIARAVERSLGTVANTLTACDRFARLDVDQYGLAEWEGERYDGIVEAMRQAIRCRGGVATGQEILSDVLGRFSVSENSIKVYLGSSQFVRIGKGLYRVRGSAESVVVSTRVPLESSASCFLLKRGWALRLRITDDRMRGSGVGITQAFAQHIGLQPGSTIDLPVMDASGKHRLGNIRFSWPVQMPNIGSIGNLIEYLDLALGDLLFLEWDAEAHILRARATKSIAAADPSERHVQARIGMLIGRPVSSETTSVDILKHLGESLGLGTDAARMQVLGRLRTRGDDELVDLSRILYDLEAMRIGV